MGVARWRRHSRRLLFLGLVAGIVGGAILGALAGARRTASAYDRLFSASGSPHADRLMKQLDQTYPYGVSDESPARAPGPVRNLEQIRRLPLVLALFFGFLGAAALAQAIFMTATERRRDLSVLRVLGYTRRQFGAVVRGAGASVAIAALAIGVPVGILAGRFGWRVIANGLDVATNGAIAFIGLAAVTFGLLAFAVLVALIPAHLALRRTPGAALRTE